LALVAVEDHGAGERRVSIMLAARAEMRAVIDGQIWDGFDIVALRESFLGRRLQDYFR
jgi:hypothetical protein